MTTNNDAVNALFKALRRHGLLARRNFSCCGGCAGSELGSKVEAGRALGAVYYHRQEGARLREGQEEVTLAYGAREVGSLTTTQIGQLIVDEAAALGLTSDWDGTPEQCVSVNLPGGIDAHWAHPDMIDPIPAGATALYA